MKIGAIIQARVGSTRLPEKVLKNICGKSVLDHVITRVRQSKYIDEIIIATTILDRDIAIINEAEKIGVKSFCGSEDDVLSRYYLAAKENSLDVIVRITSDCPLIDSKVIDEVVKTYLDNKYDIVTNAGSDLSQRTYPRGLDTEVFSFEALENAYKNAVEKYQREHVTPYIYENAKEVFYYKNSTDYSKYRWTLDTEEDFEVISKIYENLYDDRNIHNFYLMDIVKLFEEKPELYDINAHIEQKKLK
ncbi:MAG: cytidylyltransferase domain-containing protein [Lachnospirales bacterium]